MDSSLLDIAKLEDRAAALRAELRRVESALRELREEAADREAEEREWIARLRG